MAICVQIRNKLCKEQELTVGHRRWPDRKLDSTQVDECKVALRRSLKVSGNRCTNSEEGLKSASCRTKAVFGRTVEIRSDFAKTARSKTTGLRIRKQTFSGQRQELAELVLAEIRQVLPKWQ